MVRKLSYVNMGRGGNVVYKDAVSAIKFDFEFGGGNCVAIIFIPAPQQWAAATQRSVGDREGILEFVAAQAVKDQASGGYYKISDNFIELFRG